MTSPNTMDDKLYFIKLNENAQIPTRIDIEDAGYDLHSLEEIIINPGERTLVDTGIAVKIPKNYCGLIYPRSGLSLKKFDVTTGIIDRNYSGSLKIIVTNNSNFSYKVKKYDRIAQFLCHFHYSVDAKEMSLSDFNILMQHSARKNKGFGHSGV